jgi:hypothetical protein
VASGSTGSYVVRNVPCVTTSTPRPASGPAYVTIPAPAARTGAPSYVARSTPRCPGPHRVRGGSNGRRTTTGDTGATQRRPPAADAAAGAATTTESPHATSSPATSRASNTNAFLVMHHRLAARATPATAPRANLWTEDRPWGQRGYDAGGWLTFGYIRSRNAVPS